jgi:serine/threonine protein kinase
MKQSPSAGHVDRLRNEIQVLKRLSHPHLVTVIGSFEDRSYFGILISPVADTDLSAFLEMRGDMGKSINEAREKLAYGGSVSIYNSVLMSFYGCLAEAFSFLHSKGVRHGDIKPQILLIKMNPDNVPPNHTSILLTDFGLARQRNVKTMTMTMSITTKGDFEDYTELYAPPEVINHKVCISLLPCYLRFIYTYVVLY